MDISDYWPRLIVFRTVASTEHLPTASKVLGVSPSALSRTIGLLESETNLRLFTRIGRRMQLTHEGRVFLNHVKSAIDLVEFGLNQATSGNLPKITIGVTSFFFQWMYPSITTITTMLDSPLDIVRIPDDQPDTIAREQCDVLVTHNPDVAGANQRTSLLCTWPLAVIGQEDREYGPIAEQRFCVNESYDLWPKDWERTVAIRCSSFSEVASAVETADCIGMVPWGGSTRNIRGLAPLEIDLPGPPELRIYIVRNRQSKSQIDDLIELLLGYFSDERPYL